MDLWSCLPWGREVWRPGVAILPEGALQGETPYRRRTPRTEAVRLDGPIRVPHRVGQGVEDRADLDRGELVAGQVAQPLPNRLGGPSPEQLNALLVQQCCLLVQDLGAGDVEERYPLQVQDHAPVAVHAI